MGLLRMQPEGLVVDTAHGTNGGGVNIAGKGGTNILFIACRNFVPNSRKWFFQILCDQCLSMFCDTIMIRIRLLLAYGHLSTIQALTIRSDYLFTVCVILIWLDKVSQYTFNHSFLTLSRKILVKWNI